MSVIFSVRMMGFIENGACTAEFKNVQDAIDWCAEDSFKNIFDMDNKEIVGEE